MDAQALLRASARVLFVSASDHEVREQPIQPRGWTGLAKELRSSRRTLRRGNARTVQCQFSRILPGESNRKNSSRWCAPSIDAAPRCAVGCGCMV